MLDFLSHPLRSKDTGDQKVSPIYDEIRNDLKSQMTKYLNELPYATGSNGLQARGHHPAGRQQRTGLLAVSPSQGEGKGDWEGKAGPGKEAGCWPEGLAVFSSCRPHPHPI